MPPGTAKIRKRECQDLIEIFLSLVILCFISMGKVGVGGGVGCNQQQNFELVLARASWRQLWQLLSDAVNHTTSGLNCLAPCARLQSVECAKEFPSAYHVCKSLSALKHLHFPLQRIFLHPPPISWPFCTQKCW